MLCRVEMTHRDTTWIVVVLAEERVPAVIIDHEALPAVDAGLNVPSVPVVERKTV